MYLNHYYLVEPSFLKKNKDWQVPFLDAWTNAFFLLNLDQNLAREQNKNESSFLYDLIMIQE